MIVKSADSKEPDLSALEGLLAKAEVRQQKLITAELRRIRAGIKGEQESAYLLDFHFGNSKKTSVVHDLRLEVGARIAQIDHLVIHHTHRFYVLETKNFAHGLKITPEGEFLRWNSWTKTYAGMPSPVEQNRRHALVLREMLERLGYKDPQIECFVLVSSAARIDRPTGNRFPEVVKADQFLTAYQKDLDAALSSVTGLMGGLSKAILGEKPEVLAYKLAQMHRPIKFDFASKFGMRAGPESQVNLQDTPKTAATATNVKSLDVSTEWGRSAGTATKPLKQVDELRCKSCQGTALAIAYGKFGYFLKCSDCDGNTAIKIGCGVSGHKERIRKDGLTFYRECVECGTSSAFFTNRCVPTR